MKINYFGHFQPCVAKKVLVMGRGEVTFDLVGTVDELLNLSDTVVCVRLNSTYKEAQTNPMASDLTEATQKPKCAPQA